MSRESPGPERGQTEELELLQRVSGGGQRTSSDAGQISSEAEEDVVSQVLLHQSLRLSTRWILGK